MASSLQNEKMGKAVGVAAFVGGMCLLSFAAYRHTSPPLPPKKGSSGSQNCMDDGSKAVEEAERALEAASQLVERTTLRRCQAQTRLLHRLLAG